MANIIEWFFRMKDGISTPLTTVSKKSDETNKALNVLTGTSDKLAKNVLHTGTNITDLKAKIERLKQSRDLIPESATKQLKAANREITELTEKMAKMETMNGGSKVKGWFNDALEEVPPILKNPITIIGAGIGVALNEGLKNSKEKLDFELLIGDDAGGKLFESLKKNKALLGEAALTGGKELLQAGVDVAKVNPMIKSLGDVSGGSQEKLAALTAGMADVQKEGKLTEGNLGALSDAGFKPLTILSQKTGESMKHLQQRLADGKISANEIGKALEYATAPGGQFFGVMDKIANSPSGQLEIFKTKIFGLAEGLGTALLPVASTVFNVLSTGIDYLNTGVSVTVSLFEQSANWVKKNEDVMLPLGGAVLGLVTAYQLFQFQQEAGILWKIKDSVITPILTAAKGGLTAATTGLATAQGFLNAMFLASPIGWVVVGIGALVGGVVLAWKKFEGFRKVIYGLWESFKTVFNSIGRLFKQIFSPIGEAIAAIKEGRWGDAVKATGKLLFNVSPVGIIKNTVEFTKNGGWSGVGDAYKRGEVEGEKSWIKSQADKKKAATSKANSPASSILQPNKTAYWKNRQGTGATATAGNKDGLNAVSGGGVKNITVTIGKMIESMNNTFTNGTAPGVNEIERMVEEALVRAIASASGR